MLEDRRRLRRAGAALATVLLVGSCRAAGPGGAADRSSAPPRTEPPGSEPSGSGSAFVNGGDCPPAAGDRLPGRAGCASTVVAVDGTLVVYALVDAASRPRSWRVRLTSDAGEIDRRLDAGNEYSYPRAVGSSDVDGDGRQEWWIKVADFTSHGAPWSSLNVFFARRDRLVPLTWDGQPLGVNFGGIARLGEGAECRGARLVLLRAEARDRRNTRWRTSERTFSIHGTRARLEYRRQGLLVIEDYNDPDLDPYYRVDCAAFVHPPPT
ncbi:MAG: hypothetical protein ABR575_00590 [Actinomycetota bacterium]